MIQHTGCFVLWEEKVNFSSAGTKLINGRHQGAVQRPNQAAHWAREARTSVWILFRTESSAPQGFQQPEGESSICARHHNIQHTHTQVEEQEGVTDPNRPVTLSAGPIWTHSTKHQLVLPQNTLEVKPKATEPFWGARQETWGCTTKIHMTSQPEDGNQDNRAWNKNRTRTKPSVNGSWELRHSQTWRLRHQREANAGTHKARRGQHRHEESMCKQGWSTLRWDRIPLFTPDMAASVSDSSDKQDSESQYRNIHTPPINTSMWCQHEICLSWTEGLFYSYWWIMCSDYRCVSSLTTYRPATVRLNRHLSTLSPIMKNNRTRSWSRWSTRWDQTPGDTRRH